MGNEELVSAVNVIIKLSSEFQNDDAVSELTTAFRKLRNKCAEGEFIQNEIASHDNFLGSTFIVLQGILDNESCNESQNLCLLIGLQMIANLLVKNKEVQSKVWKLYQKKVISCLWCNNPKVQNCAIMIMYNVFLGNPDHIVFDKDIFCQIIHLTRGEHFSEFAIYILQLYISKTKYIQENYHSFLPGVKLMLLDVIRNYIVNEEKCLGKELILFFVEKFQNFSENFVGSLAEIEYSEETYETVKILDILSSIAGGETDLRAIQNYENLLVTSVKLLKTIHNVSKEPGNNFTRIQRLSELDALENRITLQEGLSFGVKGNIIRLIGNLCWKNEENQNKVRELEAIPVLLDCCSIDGRNPFILQWTILAIRNLCDSNKENQKFIASISSKGALDLNKMMEMGIILNKENDGSSVSVAPLKMQE